MECAICYDTLGGRRIVDCNRHSFHEDCLQVWVASRKDDILTYRGALPKIPCPLCEQDLLSKLSMGQVFKDGPPDKAFYASSRYTDHINQHQDLYRWMFRAAVPFAAEFKNAAALCALVKLRYPLEHAALALPSHGK